MLFERLILENFRAYGGRQELDLRPQSSQPIVLVTGLNGAGKTTLLEALYLVLYGKRTPSPRRSGKAYEGYLGECIHRSATEGTQATVGLTISQTLQGRPVTYELIRSWSLTRGGVREVMEVAVDGRFDTILTEEWGQYIEDLLPSRLAPLFFFDGEKIESLADLDATAEVLSVAIHSLLGLDLVDRLDQDLDVLERRRVSDLEDSGPSEDLKLLEAAEGHADREAQLKHDELARLQADLDRAGNRAREAREAFEAQGGEAFAQQAKLEKKFGDARETAQGAVSRLQHLASGVSPLLLIPVLLQQVADQAAAERVGRESQVLDRLLVQRDASLIKSLKRSAPSGEWLGKLEQWLERDRDERQSAASIKPYLELAEADSAYLDHLLETSLPELRHQIHDALEVHRAAQRGVEQAEQRLASVPEADQLETVREAWDRARDELARLETSAERAAEDFRKAQDASVMAQEQRKRGLRRFVETQKRSSDTRRVLRHSERVRTTLKIFRGRVLERHIERIQELMLDGLRRLLRKKSLVKNLEIDPSDFSLSLFGADGRHLSPEDLSAGERQLLATALLWGLARASGRPMPTLIDTPLGRLDSVHRELLVDRYFPNASHQVILLSTDEEISGPVLERLRDRIGRSYVLIHDDVNGLSSVVEGFPEGVMVG